MFPCNVRFIDATIVLYQKEEICMIMNDDKKIILISELHDTSDLVRIIELCRNYINSNE